MSKPLIGLTTSLIRNANQRSVFGVNEPYARSVSNAGGLPLLIPLNQSNEDLDDLLAHLDGILFTGGGDIDPRLYGNSPHPKVKGISTERDRLEDHLVHAILQAGKPFLGVCRGCQVINVALGGSLYEHLPEQFPGSVMHDNHDHPRDYLAHQVKINPGTRLAHIVSDDTNKVNSLHHQGVCQLAQGLCASAYATDGLIEAFELPAYPFGLAVQWHPEELQEYAPMRNLFREFVLACKAATGRR
jgi:putative glutamine amidotransferase